MSLKISIIESLYLIFMFHFFKTTINFSKGTYDSNFFHHSLNDEANLRICPFGRVTIFVLIFILISRHFIKYPSWFIIIMWIITVLLSFMNMNAVLYLLPVEIVELKLALPYL